MTVVGRGGFYTSAEVKSVYSTVSADWAVIVCCQKENFSSVHIKRQIYFLLDLYHWFFFSFSLFPLLTKVSLNGIRSDEKIVLKQILNFETKHSKFFYNQLKY